MATSTASHPRLGRHWGWMAALAVISIIGGVLALLNPFAATLAAVLFAGWTFVLMGVVQLVQAFQVRDWSGFLWALLFGVLTLFVGIALLWNPLAGMITLTFLVAVLLFVTGVVKVMFSFSLRPMVNWVWVLLSGILSIVLAIMIFAYFPQASLAVLGIFLGIELLSNGILFLFVALGLRRLRGV